MGATHCWAWPKEVRQLFEACWVRVRCGAGQLPRGLVLWGPEPADVLLGGLFVAVVEAAPPVYLVVLS